LGFSAVEALAGPFSLAAATRGCSKAGASPPQHISKLRVAGALNGTCPNRGPHTENQNGLPNPKSIQVGKEEHSGCRLPGTLRGLGWGRLPLAAIGLCGGARALPFLMLPSVLIVPHQYCTVAQTESHVRRYIIVINLCHCEAEMNAGDPDFSRGLCKTRDNRGLRSRLTLRFSRLRPGPFSDGARTPPLLRHRLSMERS